MNSKMQQIPQRVINHQGLNIPASQDTHVPHHLKHEIVVVPSTSAPAWGSYFVFDFKEKALTLHKIAIQFNVSAITGFTSSATPSDARYTTAYGWFNRIEIVQNNQVIDTIYPDSQFLLNNLFHFDEDRSYINNAAGNYASVTQRALLATTASNYYIDLWTYFNQAHPDLLYPKDDIQLRVYLDSFLNNFAGSGTGTPVSKINFANLLCSVTRLNSDINSSKLFHLSKQVHHHKFNETRYATYALNNTGTQYTVVLNAIVGKVSFLLFVIRPQTAVGDDWLKFSALSQFSILDSTSTNITGGQPVLSELALGLYAKEFAKSSYLSETARGITNNNAYAYFYSFGADAEDTISSGRTYNHWDFQGNEQLQIQFASTPSAAFTVDVYAYVNSVLEISPSYVKKLQL